jgi:hypothetical protein
MAILLCGLLLGSGLGLSPVVASCSVLQEKEDRPRLTSSDIFAGPGEELKQVTDAQMKVLQRLIDVTDDNDAEKPDLLFRMAELYAEQVRYYDFHVRKDAEELTRARKERDDQRTAALVQEIASSGLMLKEWHLKTVKKYLEVATTPKYSTYQKMRADICS